MPCRLLGALLLLTLGAASCCEALAELDVVAHGADSTGVRDCTDLLTRLHATGRPVYYPNGVYRFSGMALDLSGGVRFETPDGVIVRNDISPANVLQLDDAGNLIGLQHNHLELDERKLGGREPMRCGSLVPAPLSAGALDRRVDLLGYWYNDFGLEHRRATVGAGWIGWYYWTWNFHGAPGDGYDPSRHPLLGFYRGDDPAVLDWQCYWLSEYGVAGVILYATWRRDGTGVGEVAGWEAPDNYNHWLYQLLRNVPNFGAVRYVMTAPTPYASSSPETMARVERQWEEMLAGTYLSHGSPYCITRGGQDYPLIYLHEEAGLRGVFDNYNGCARTLAFYRRIAARLREHGYGGVALLCRHGITQQMADLDALEKDGVLHYSGQYAAMPAEGTTYAQRVASYSPPADPRAVPNVVTSCHSHTPHPSKWDCPGSTPELFGQLLEKAVRRVEGTGMPPVITCYNVAEWAEGGPGLQPNMRDRFGYLEAVRNAVSR